jgi:hypothetical protein
MAEWQIEQFEDRDTFDVSVDGRQVQYDCVDLEEAIEVVRAEVGPHDEVALVEADGYRTDLVI